MSNTRGIIAPGQFAADAVTVIPPTPTLGVAYRDQSTSAQDAEDGWSYGTRVDSATFNQIMYQLSGLMRILDAQGLLGWTNGVDYVAGALTIGSDGVLYRARIANGPNNGTAVDPTFPGTTWERFGAAAATGAEVSAGVEANKFVSPATLLSGLLGASNLAASGVARIPINVGGVRLLLMVQWGGGSASDNSQISFPEQFPNACFRVIGSDSNGREVFGSTLKTNSGFRLRTSTGGNLLQFDYIAIGW